MYFVLGIAFLFISVTMNFDLKRYFLHFYDRYSCFLWAACFFLTIPLFVRAIIDLSKNISDPFYKWYNDPDHFATADNTYLIFSTYIPIIGQMSSLVFGYTRKRQEERMTEHIKMRRVLFENPGRE